MAGNGLDAAHLSALERSTQALKDLARSLASVTRPDGSEAVSVSVEPSFLLLRQLLQELLGTLSHRDVTRLKLAGLRVHALWVELHVRRQSGLLPDDSSPAADAQPSSQPAHIDLLFTHKALIASRMSLIHLRRGERQGERGA